MKKITTILFLVTFTLLGCQAATTLSITELERIDSEVEQMIRIEEVMQLIYVEGQPYIVLYSEGDVSVALEEDGDTVMIHFDVEDADGNGMKRQVYALSMEPEHEAIEVFVNGELVPFDYVIV